MLKNIAGKQVYTLYDVYKIDEESNVVETVKFAEWDPLNGLTIAEPNIWKRRSNLKGHHLRYTDSISIYLFLLG